MSPAAVVLTNERLSSHLNTVERANQFRSWAERYFSHIDIVVYLRRQDEMLLAMYSTNVKTGRTSPFRVPLPAAGEWDRYDYEKILGIWGAAFPEGRMSVRVFEREQLVDGDVVADFCETVGIRMQGLSTPAWKNVSFGSDALEYLRRLNRHLPYVAPPTVVGGRSPWSPGISELRGGLLTALDEVTAGSSSLTWTSPDGRAEFLDRYASSNRRIARDYLQRGDGDLFTRHAPAVEQGSPPELDMDRSFEISAGLWAFQRRRVIELEAERKALRQEVRRLRRQRASLRQRLRRREGTDVAPEVDPRSADVGVGLRPRMKELRSRMQTLLTRTRTRA